jgi:hypothetical protein
MKTEKQVQVLRTILLIGGFMIGVGYYVNAKGGGAK